MTTRLNAPELRAARARLDDLRKALRNSRASMLDAITAAEGAEFDLYRASLNAEGNHIDLAEVADLSIEAGKVADLMRSTLDASGESVTRVTTISIDLTNETRKTTTGGAK